MKLPVLYLHGFASSPDSNKAAFLSHRFRTSGQRVVIPDLNCGDFPTITVSKMLSLAQTEAGGIGGPFVCVGSSMGGYIAALLASGAVVSRPLSAVPRPSGLILMAPALHPVEIWQRDMKPEEFARWKETGLMDVEHHGYGKKLPLHFGFIEDAGKYPPCPDIGNTPCLIIHGTNDTVVPVTLSEEFVCLHRQIDLRPVLDDHEIKNSLPLIGRLSEEFLSKLENL
ncbi:MAG: alpha/beta fold hydrolase [Deltaproteobacteria bacterium]|nr:alpha/beta fold hydrolase [Deltaproteobacteria bacterium]